MSLYIGIIKCGSGNEHALERILLENVLKLVAERIKTEETEHVLQIDTTDISRGTHLLGS